MRKLFDDYFQGNISKRFLIFVCGSMAVFFFAGGIVLAACFFPGSYDWRYQGMSILWSRADNPAGHLFWSLGLVSALLLCLPSCGYFLRRLEPWSPRVAHRAGFALRTGYIAGILVGLESAFFPNFGGYIYKAHEYTAIVAFSGIYLGAAGFWYCLTVWLLEDRRWLAWAMGGLFLLCAAPVAGAILSQAWLFFDPHRPPWVSPEWVRLGIPLWLSIAFWEWLGACGLVICVTVLAIVLPAKPHEIGEPAVRSVPPIPPGSRFDVAVRESPESDDQK